MTSQTKRTWKVTIQYVPLPEHMRDWVYHANTRIYLEGETQRRKSEGMKKEQVLHSENVKGGVPE